MVSRSRSTSPKRRTHYPLTITPYQLPLTQIEMVLRRYTPPTCTLEITAKTSPLSFWAGQSVLKSLRFELRLDDPRLPEEQHVKLRGGRAQLDALCEVVNAYVQDFLSNQSLAGDTKPEAEMRSAAPIPSSPPVVEPLVLDESYNPYAIASKRPGSETPPLEQSPDLSSPPRLEPRGLLAHDLFLGELADATSGAVVHLSVLQLFDLATALEEYASDVMALPNLNRDRSRSNPPAWLSAAAAVVVVVGVTAGVVKLLNRSPSTEQASIQSTSPISANAGSRNATGQPLASRVSPGPTMSIQSASTPSPTASGTPKPQIPPAPTGTISPSPALPIATASPTLSAKPSPVAPPTPLFPPPAPTPAPPQQAIVIPGSVAPMPPRPEPRTSLPQPTPIVLRTAPPSPPPLKAIPPNPPLPEGTTTALGNLPPHVSGPTELPTLEDSQPTLPAPNSSKQAAATPTNRTLFDSIPQVAEARSYFQQHWQPPEELKETLEYSLQLDAKGSIQRIIPLGQAAGDYIDRTNMPLIGEPFVSAVAEGKNPRIRVVLRPNGKVQTFLEALE